MCGCAYSDFSSAGASSASATSAAASWLLVGLGDGLGGLLLDDHLGRSLLDGSILGRARLSSDGLLRRLRLRVHRLENERR